MMDRSWLNSRPLGGHDDDQVAREARLHTVTRRMLTHFLRITTATGGIILGTLLPFLPGRYDSLAPLFD